MDKKTAVTGAPGETEKKSDKNEKNARRFSAALIAVAVLIICAGIGLIAWTLIDSIPVTDPIAQVWQDNADGCSVLANVPQPTVGEVDMKRSTFQAMSCNIYILNISEKEANSYMSSLKEKGYSLAPCTDSTVLEGEVGFIRSNPSENMEIRCYKKAKSNSPDDNLEYFRIYAVPIPSES